MCRREAGSVRPAWSWRRCGPCCSAWARWTWPPSRYGGSGGRGRLEELVSRLVALGYRREYQVEHRGEAGGAGRDRRRVPLHLGSAGAHRPVGRRGRPAHRVRSRRPAVGGRPRSGRALRVPGGAPHRGRPRPGPGTWWAAPWGRAQWERLAEGQLFDGMESWLPWLVDDDRVLPDLSGPAAGWCSSIPGGCVTGPPS